MDSLCAHPHIFKDFSQKESKGVPGLVSLTSHHTPKRNGLYFHRLWLLMEVKGILHDGPSYHVRAKTKIKIRRESVKKEEIAGNRDDSTLTHLKSD